MLFSMCNWGFDGPWLFGPTIANSWRITGDLINTYDRDEPQRPCVEKQGLDCKVPGFYCSLMNVVNKVVYFPSKLSPELGMTWISCVSLTVAPFHSVVKNLGS